MGDRLEGAQTRMLPGDCNALLALIALLWSKPDSTSWDVLTQEVYNSSWSDHLWFGL